MVESKRIISFLFFALPPSSSTIARHSLVFFAYALIPLLFPFSSAWAQASGIAPAQRAEEGLRRQEERLREQLQQQTPKQDVLRPEAKESLATELPDETPCFVIEEFLFSGEEAYRFSWLKNVVAPYQGL